MYQKKMQKNSKKHWRHSEQLLLYRKKFAYNDPFPGVGSILCVTKRFYAHKCEYRSKNGFLYILNTPNPCWLPSHVVCTASILAGGALESASAKPKTERVSVGLMIPSSQSRAV